MWCGALQSFASSEWVINVADAALSYYLCYGSVWQVLHHSHSLLTKL